jgi:hypothetical protein
MKNTEMTECQNEKQQKDKMPEWKNTKTAKC